jgi:HD-GYP domain-containing protein (c-di-GMP phosphodiesterase class II)
MPLLVAVNELKPGMRLYHGIHRDQHTLLTAGQVLEEWEISKLCRLCPDLTVQISDPLLDEIVDFQDTSRDEAVASAVTRQMSGLMTRVRRKMAGRTTLKTGDISGLHSEIEQVMQYLRENPVASAILFHSGKPRSYFHEHAANVFYLSLLIGNAIRDYVYRERERTSRARSLSIRYGMNLTPLALGCLFHDLGMLPIEHLLEKAEPLTPQERELILTHPLAGAEALPREFDAVARMVVRTHHENFDGSGYPEGIPGARLHVFSRIIRACDAYDAGTSGKVYRQAKSAARVLWEMAEGPYHGHFDPVITKIMLSLIQPFPIGGKIRLNCGRFGVVVRHNRRQPFRPHIIIAFDEQGCRIRKGDIDPPIDLSKNHEIQLREFAGDSLSFLSDFDEGFMEIADADGQMTETLFDFVYP